jgi:hypothetical protein
MKNKNTVPIGVILQEAGLVTEKQVNVALKTQEKYNKLLLGEILVLQGTIKRQTVEFFVEQWQDLQAKGKQYPLGFYLQKAGLLDEEQVKSILLEREKTRLKFGAVAVKKGWLKQSTIDFFIENLPAKPIQPVSLKFLEKYNRSTLNLETKSDNVDRVLQEIINWTGGHPILTKTICSLVANHNSYIVTGREKFIIENIIKNSIIDNWQRSKTTDYIRILEDNILNNQTYHPYALLRLYQRVLLEQTVLATDSEAEKELLILGLLTKKQNKLYVANRIYSSIFNLNWVETHLDRLQQLDLEQADEDRVELKPQKNEPLAKISSIVALIGILSLIPAIVFFKKDFDRQPENNLSLSSTFDRVKLPDFCANTIPYRLIELNQTILKLERERQKLQDNFPEDCEMLLHKLWVLEAPTLGKGNHAIEAIDDLCKIPSNSESFNQAKFWIDRWYESPYWGEQTKSYLNLVDSCPAAEGL